MSRPVQGWSWHPKLLLLLATALAYAGILGGSFQYDDFNVIVDEPGVHSLGAWWAGSGGLRPLLKLSYALNWMSNPHPAGFLAVNLAVHLASVVLVFAVLQRLLRQGGAEPLGQERGAFAGALLFALHPLQTEAVAYVSGRSVSLSALVVLLSVLAYLKRRERPDRPWMLWISAGLFLPALALKETALLLPALLALVELGAPAGARRPLRGPWMHWTLAGLAAGSLALHPAYHRLLASASLLRSPGEQVRAALSGIAYLAEKLFWPVRLNLDPPLRIPGAWSPGLVAWGLGLILLAAFGIGMLRRKAWVGLGILWILLSLLPTHGPIARLDLANERHLYLGMLGAGLLWGGIVAALPSRSGGLLAAVLSVLLGVRTFLRVRDYRDETAMWASSVAAAPGNPRAWNNLGVARWLTGDVSGARRCFQEALRLAPRYALARKNLASVEAPGAASAERP